MISRYPSRDPDDTLELYAIVLPQLRPEQARPIAERAQVAENDWVVVIPAFVITQLIEAFALGFLIYLPFLVIDLVVANVLLALGMQMVTPMQFSLPFKLLLFVAIDGWGLISQALVTGYHLS